MRHQFRIPVIEGPLPEVVEAGGGEFCRRGLAKEGEGIDQAGPGVGAVDRTGSGLLAQFGAGRIDHQRVMEVGRFRQAEQSLQVQLGRGQVEQIGTADDLGHPLFGIVDHHSELVGKQAVGTPDDEITEVTSEVELMSAKVAVLKADDRTRSAQSGRGGTVTAPYARSTTPWVDRPGDPVTSRLGDVATTATARVAPTRGRELFQGGLVGLAAAALVEHRTVPDKAMVLKRGKDGIGGAGHLSRRVDVLDPDQPAAIVPTRL